MQANCITKPMLFDYDTSGVKPTCNAAVENLGVKVVETLPY